jgi:two-component system NtrC family sensor kinase
MDEITAYKRALERERLARARAEHILEEKTRELFIAQQSLQNNYDEIRQHLAKSELMFSLSQLVHSDISIDEVLQFFIDGVCQLEGWSIGHIYLVSIGPDGEPLLVPSDIWYFNDEERYEFFKEATEQSFFKSGIGLPGRTYQSQTPYWVNDVMMDPNFPRKKMMEQAGLLGAFGLPIMRYKEVIAVAEFFTDSAIPQDKRLTEMMVTAANQLGAMLERQFNETKLMTHYKELEGIHLELKETQAQLLQHSKLASIGQLAAGVAHEINNPIAFVSSNIELLQGYFSLLKDMFAKAQALFDLDLKSDKDIITTKNEWQSFCTQRNISEIIELAPTVFSETVFGLERVSEIVADLKSFSHVEENEMQEIDINACLNLTLKIIHNELKYKCTIHKKYAQLPLLKCYSRQINQVFMNILLNASQAIADKGDIYIQTEIQHNYIVVKITDSGIGINPENLDKLFDPFFTTKPVGQGTGLGLSISYNIVKKHGGHIDVQSKTGESTTFSIYLPLQSLEQENAQYALT